MGDPVDNPLEKFIDHLNVKIVKENVCIQSLFRFTEISVSEMTKELSRLISMKARAFGNIPTKVLKTSFDNWNKVLQKIWNSKILGKQYFSTNSKLPDIKPAYKKNDPTLAKNCRPVSILPTIFKVFERIIQKQLSTHIERSLVEKWRKCFDNKGYTGALLIDLSQ